MLRPLHVGTLSPMTVFVYAHLVTIIPVLFLGPGILFRQKGDGPHHLMGKWWAGLIGVSSQLSFGIQHSGGLSWLHVLSAYTIYGVAMGVRAARGGDVCNHRMNMIGSYLGASIAFGFSLHPSRLVGKWVASWPG